MLLLLSPSKTLDFETPLPSFNTSAPRFQKETAELLRVLKTKTPDDLKALMHISDKLAKLNTERIKAFEKAHSRPALFAFKGDVYAAMDVADYSSKQLTYANEHLRILSGLYGLLRPLDLIKPHRLEMGTRLSTARGKTLYDFWGSRITDAMHADLGTDSKRQVVNLASAEYFQAVGPKAVPGTILHIDFKEHRKGVTKTIALFAKQARGMMADFAIKEMLRKPEDLKAFCVKNYRYQKTLSSESRWVFVRAHKD